MTHGRGVRTEFEAGGVEYTGEDPAAQARLEQFLAKVKASGLGENEVGVFSAHQMGSCRMGADPRSSVVDEDGEMWECDSVYLCDASTFPTASGSNPMMSTLSLSTTQ